MIVFAAISPHPPLLLPHIGKGKEKQKVQNTLSALKTLGDIFKKLSPQKIIISSPHPDWGINVPLYFLISNENSFKIAPYKEISNLKTIKETENKMIFPFLTTDHSPQEHFEEGKNFFEKNKKIIQKQKFAIIASADLSHCLKQDGPYGFQPDGPVFDQKLIQSLKNHDIETILKLDQLYPLAGECGLRSICFLLGVLEAAKIKWKANILSYEGPFGVGYLVAQFQF